MKQRSAASPLAAAGSVVLAVLLLFSGSAASAASAAASADDALKIVIVRHGEKPEVGESLSCQGFNRAMQLPAVLISKFGKPDFTYVPSLKLGESTNHLRMLQTATPISVRYDLALNSKFDEDDVSGVAAEVLERTGLVLMVWEHSQIPALTMAFGVEDPPKWKKNDFDSIWIISRAHDRSSMTIDAEQIIPSSKCAF